MLGVTGTRLNTFEVGGYRPALAGDSGTQNSPSTALAAPPQTVSAPRTTVTSAGGRESYLAATGFDHAAMQRRALEGKLSRSTVAQAAAPQSRAVAYVEKYPAAQGLRFSESKGAAAVAYHGREGEVYRFPDGKAWRVAEVQDLASGFRAVVLRPADPHNLRADDPRDNRVVIAYAGTEPDLIHHTEDSLKDWGNNIPQAIGGVPEQYRQAVALASKYRARGENVILTGHSLGGGLASYASVVTGAPATAINSAPLGRGTLPGLKRFDPQINGRITQYYVPGEILTDFANRPDARLLSARPGRQIPVPGRYLELPVKGWALYASLQNHGLENLATDVPLPRRVSLP